jgi:hypothetical protein
LKSGVSARRRVSGVLIFFESVDQLPKRSGLISGKALLIHIDEGVFDVRLRPVDVVEIA